MVNKSSIAQSPSNHRTRHSKPIMMGSTCQNTPNPNQPSKAALQIKVLFSGRHTILSAPFSKKTPRIFREPGPLKQGETSGLPRPAQGAASAALPRREVRAEGAASPGRQGAGGLVHQPAGGEVKNAWAQKNDSGTSPKTPPRFAAQRLSGRRFSV